MSCLLISPDVANNRLNQVAPSCGSECRCSLSLTIGDCCGVAVVLAPTGADVLQARGCTALACRNAKNGSAKMGSIWACPVFSDSKEGIQCNPSPVIFAHARKIGFSGSDGLSTPSRITD